MPNLYRLSEGTPGAKSLVWAITMTTQKIKHTVDNWEKKKMAAPMEGLEKKG